jgi:hypothetical protein
MRVILLAISVLIAGITLYCSNKDADAQRLLDKDIELSKNSKVRKNGFYFKIGLKPRSSY